LRIVRGRLPHFFGRSVIVLGRHRFIDSFHDHNHIQFVQY